MHRRNGFSLIELLVSVAIISSLVAILLPALSAVRRTGHRTTCQTRLHEIGRAIWAYSVANDSRVPYVESPMTNGIGEDFPGFGNDGVPDEDLNPYDRDLWPLSLQNVLMSLYLGEAKNTFVCPAAVRGWPRFGGSFQMTYRDAGANQPNGQVDREGGYLRESFGFLDGRPMQELRFKRTGNIITDSQMHGAVRGTYVRDMVLRDGQRVIGPHDGGINVINREFGVEYRNPATAQADLAPFGAGVQF